MSRKANKQLLVETAIQFSKVTYQFTLHPKGMRDAELTSFSAPGIMRSCDFNF